MSLIHQYGLGCLFSFFLMTKAICNDYANSFNYWTLRNCDLTTQYDQMLGLPEGTPVIYRLGSQRDSTLSSILEFPKGTNEVTITINCQLTNSLAFWLLLQLDTQIQEIESDKLAICQKQWAPIQQTFPTTQGAHSFVIAINSPSNVDQEWLAIDNITAVACPSNSQGPFVNFSEVLAMILALVVLIGGAYFLIYYYKKSHRSNSYKVTDDDLGL